MFETGSLNTHFLLWSQNLSVNGANSNDTLINMRLLRRNATADHPLVVFYAMNGNDVCNWHHDTIPYMSSTKVGKRDNLFRRITWLSTLPAHYLS